MPPKIEIYNRATVCTTIDKAFDLNIVAAATATEAESGIPKLWSPRITTVNN